MADPGNDVDLRLRNSLRPDLRLARRKQAILLTPDDQRLVRNTAQPSAEIGMAHAMYLEDVAERGAFLLARGDELIGWRSLRPAGEVAQRHLDIVGKVGREILRRDRRDVGADMIGVVEAGGRVEDEAVEALAGESRHLGRHPAAHRMADEVRL